MSAAVDQITEMWQAANAQGANPDTWNDLAYKKIDDLPWRDKAPNPFLVAWLEKNSESLAGQEALVIGCGDGYDAAELAKYCETTGFDVSPTAIEGAQERFDGPGAPKFVVANLFEPSKDWKGRFGFVFEGYTIQVLDTKRQPEAVSHVADFVAPGGRLLVATRRLLPGEETAGFRRPLSRKTLDLFLQEGLDEVSVDAFLDNENPPVPRFVAQYRRGEEA